MYLLKLQLINLLLIRANEDLADIIQDIIHILLNRQF